MQVGRSRQSDILQRGIGSGEDFALIVGHQDGHHQFGVGERPFEHVGHVRVAANNLSPAAFPFFKRVGVQAAGGGLAREMIHQVNLELVGDQIGAGGGGAEGHSGEIIQIQQGHRDDNQGDQHNDRDPEPGLERHLSACTRLGLSSAVFLQFVEKRLEADTQNFRCPGLVVLGVLQGELNERLLGLSHSGTDLQSDDIRFHFLRQGP